MMILASDTSTWAGSVAVRMPDGEIMVEELDRTSPHSETLLPAVERLLDAPPGSMPIVDDAALTSWFVE